jgi:hypothetical protein
VGNPTNITFVDVYEYRMVLLDRYILVFIHNKPLGVEAAVTAWACKS